MMADTGFLKGLVEFDKDSLSEKQVLFSLMQIALLQVLVTTLCQITLVDQTTQMHLKLLNALHHRHTACSITGKYS